MPFEELISGNFNKFIKIFLNYNDISQIIKLVLLSNKIAQV